jgi:hypothetical protein
MDYPAEYIHSPSLGALRLRPAEPLYLFELFGRDIRRTHILYAVEKAAVSLIGQD